MLLCSATEYIKHFLNINCFYGHGKVNELSGTVETRISKCKVQCQELPYPRILAEFFNSLKEFYFGVAVLFPEK